MPEDTAVAAVDGQNDGQFADQGEADFKAGNYKAAARDWQHALVDDPQNGAIMMLLAQALLALGQYDEAAGATQAAMQMLPEDKWGVVVTNYAQLYGNPQDYTDQLKAVEKARDANPEIPGFAIPVGLSLRVFELPEECRHGVGQGADRGAQGFGSVQAAADFRGQVARGAGAAGRRGRGRQGGRKPAAARRTEAPGRSSRPRANQGRGDRLAELGSLSELLCQSPRLDVRAVAFFARVSAKSATRTC